VPINVQSVSSLLLELRSGGTAIGTATGFVVRRPNTLYLVTNRHVVRGRHQETNQALHPSAAVPDEVVVHHNALGAPGTWVSKVQALYGADGTRLWHEHPVHAGAMDVVALPLTQLGGVELYPYDPWNAGPAIRCGPTDQVSIVGFPFGLAAGGLLGIWVQGTIASEPDIEYNGLPVMLVDSRTRQGQSGSPVIAHRSGGMVALDDGGSAVFNGPVTRFMGVYSGRINAESDLGFVWKARGLTELLQAAPA